jgi:hypothetical protein
MLKKISVVLWIPELRYEIYLFSGLNPGKFRAKDGLRKGRQAVAEAKTNGLAVAGLSYRPIPQAVFKFDLIQRFFGGQADDQTILDLGVGFMF